MKTSMSESSNISDKFKDKTTEKFFKNFLKQNHPNKKAENNKNLIDKFKKEEGKLETIIDNIFKKNNKLSKTKLPSQNEAIEILEKEKEKDKNTRDTIEIIIQMIKDFFSNKFNAEEAKKKIMETIKNDKMLTSKTLDFLEKNLGLELFAKKILGENFVDHAKKKAISSIKSTTYVSRT